MTFSNGYIPFMVKQDYNKVKEIYIDYTKMKSNEISKETFHRNLIKKISDEVGIPEFVSEKILNKVIKEKPLEEPIVSA